MENKNSLQIVSLKAKANNKYVSAWLDDKDVPLITKVDHKKAWEQFQLINNEKDSISLKAINGKYVSASLDSKEVPLTANVDHIGKWEKFQLIKNEDGSVSLKAANEKYVSIEPERDENSRLIAQAPEITHSEHFGCESEDMTYKSSKVLNYLYLISGFKTIAGQHNQESKNENPFDPALSTNNIYKITGKYPALWSGDFLFNQEYVTSPIRRQMIEEAIRQWEQGAIVNIMWHACPPTQSEPCNWDGGVLSHLSDQEWNELISDGTTLNNEWKSRLDNIAEYLQSLKESGVEVLWRPFHEMNQGKFWWGGRPGSHGTQKLYKITYDYLVKTKGLTNLIWVWNVQDFSTLSQDLINYNPGDDYWDIVALDIYGSDGQGFTEGKYKEMVEVAGHKLIAIGECFSFPTITELNEQPRWIFFMGWAEDVFKHNPEEKIRQLYNASNILTRDQMALLIRGMNC